MTTYILLVSWLGMLDGTATFLHRFHGAIFNTTGGQFCLTLKQTFISQFLLQVIINLSLMYILPWL